MYKQFKNTVISNPTNFFKTI